MTGLMHSAYRSRLPLGEWGSKYIHPLACTPQTKPGSADCPVDPVKCERASLGPRRRHPLRPVASV